MFPSSRLNPQLSSVIEESFSSAYLFDSIDEGLIEPPSPSQKRWTLNKLKSQHKLNKRLDHLLETLYVKKNRGPPYQKESNPLTTSIAKLSYLKDILTEYSKRTLYEELLTYIEQVSQQAQQQLKPSLNECIKTSEFYQGEEYWTPSGSPELQIQKKKSEDIDVPPTPKPNYEEYYDESLEKWVFLKRT